jgi:hypothetical protein
MRQLEAENNSPVSYNERQADLNLVDLPEDRQALVAMCQAQDEAERAIHEARLAKQAAARERKQELQRTRNDLQRELSHPNCDLQDAKRLQKRLAQADKAIEKANADIAAKPKRNPPGTQPRRHTSQIMAVIARNVAVRPVSVTIPKKFAGDDGFEKVRAEIDTKKKRITALYDAKLPFEDAVRRYRNAVLRLSNEADAIPFGEFATIREGAGGSFLPQAVEIKPSIFARATEAFTLAYGEERLRRLYDSLELEADAEFLSIEDRRRELAKVQKDILALEHIEGALIRSKALAGESVVIRGSMDIYALLGIEPDPDAPKRARPVYMEVPADTPASAIRPPLNRG